MELMQLRYFCCLAHGYTMQQTAEMLHISQSAVSMSLKKLEEELNTQLFDRQGRTLRLNDQGRFLLSRAEKILYEVELLKESFQGGDHSLVRPIVVYSDAIDFANEAVNLYTALSPDHQVRLIRSDHCSAQAGEIVMNANFVLSLNPFLRNVEESRLLISEPMYLLVPPEQEESTPVSITTLEGCTLITAKEGSALRSLFDDFLNAAQVTPGRRLEVTDPEVLATTVFAGQGISFIPQCCVPETRTTNKIPFPNAVRRIREQFCCRNVYMAYLKNGVSPAADRFRDFLLEFTRWVDQEHRFPSLEEFQQKMHGANLS